MMIDRSDPESAAKAAAELCPDTDVRRTWAHYALQSIGIAAAVGEKSWAVTLFQEKIRLNVGQIAVLELWPGIAVFYCCAPVSVRALQGVQRLEWGGYRAVRAETERWSVDLGALPGVPEHLIHKHLELVRLAALSKKTTPFRHAHSPGLVAYLESLVQSTASTRDGLISEPLVDAAYAEGATRQVTTNAYERSEAARAACVQRHGTTCVACGLAFGAVYGPLADGYIHIHHLRPLSEIGAKYQVDPCSDLRPVCPNCHAVIHLGGVTRSIEDVKRLLKHAARPNRRLHRTGLGTIVKRRG
jgi:5-methylcytosine-specific restriction enzyme A